MLMTSAAAVAVEQLKRLADLLVLAYAAWLVLVKHPEGGAYLPPEGEGSAGEGCEGVLVRDARGVRGTRKPAQKRGAGEA